MFLLVPHLLESGIKMPNHRKFSLSLCKRSYCLLYRDPAYDVSLTSYWNDHGGPFLFILNPNIDK